MKAYNEKERLELQEIAKSEFNNQYPCDLYGRFPWCCEYTTRHAKGKGVSLSKSNLGFFTYEVLMRGGNITQLWAFNIQPRAAVFPIFWLTLDYARVFTDETGFYIKPCGILHLNRKV